MFQTRSRVVIFGPVCYTILDENHREIERRRNGRFQNEIFCSAIKNGEKEKFYGHTEQKAE